MNGNSQFYSHKVEKVAFYKTLKLCKFYHIKPPKVMKIYPVNERAGTA